MNCGGSDGYSGLTANPLVGDVANVLAAVGATASAGGNTGDLGAHAAIARRAKDAAVGKKFLGFFPWWERYMAIFTETARLCF
ncbi:galactarate dehydratase [Anaerolineaceae bacterium]|nr:galactarate dehydratase [Anaerolineaceae bacterium]